MRQPLACAWQFVKFQEMRLQELAEDVPMGHIPRSLTAVVKGELVRGVSPGDIIEMSGIFLPKPYTGFKVRRGLLWHSVLRSQLAAKSEACMR
jgi:DNA replication licensing factor MCM7